MPNSNLNKKLKILGEKSKCENFQYAKNNKNKKFYL
jgi:hypothetical protein